MLMWAFGDTVLSVLLLSLFITSLRTVQKDCGNPQKSIEMLPTVRSFARKNRNLIFFAIFFNLVVVFIIVSLAKPKMRTVIFLCVVDRLITLQCITLTFSYDLSYFKFKVCSVFHRKPNQVIDHVCNSEYEADLRFSPNSFLVVSDSTCSTEYKYHLRTMSL